MVSALERQLHNVVVVQRAYIPHDGFELVTSSLHGKVIARVDLVLVERELEQDAVMHILFASSDATHVTVLNRSVLGWQEVLGDDDLAETLGRMHKVGCQLAANTKQPPRMSRMIDASMMARW